VPASGGSVTLNLTEGRYVWDMSAPFSPTHMAGKVSGGPSTLLFTDTIPWRPSDVWGGSLDVSGQQLTIGTATRSSASSYRFQLQ
jgi:hypothetical protein